MATIPTADDREASPIVSRFEALLPTVAPFLFVFLWSTGFISAK